MSSTPPKALFVGTGRSVLTAATALRRHNWGVEVMSRHTIPEILGSSAPLTQMSLPTTRQWERHLGLDLWERDAPPATAVSLTLTDGTSPGVRITAPLPGEATAIDSRLLTSQWLQQLDFLGGLLHIRGCYEPELDMLAGRYDLRVIGGGENNPLRTLFRAADLPTGATDRIVAQAHVENFAWTSDPYQGAGVCALMYSLPGAEVLITPVVSMVPLSPGLVQYHSGAVVDRGIVVPTIAGACVQILARPGGSFDTLPVDRRPAASAQDPNGQLPVRTSATYPPSVVWEHIRALIAERVDPDLGELLHACTLIPGSELLARVQPQVRQPVALTPTSGLPVVGIGGVTRTVEPASGHGAAAATLSGVNLAELAHRQVEAEQPLDQEFLVEAMAAYDHEHGNHTAGFGRMVNAYWTPGNPAHDAVRAMVAKLAAVPTAAAAWGTGLDQPDLMAPLLAAY